MSILKFYSEPVLPKKLKAKRKEYRENKIPTILEDSLNQLLLTVSLKSPKKILEIGTATGMSGISMLNIVKDSQLVTIEKDEESYLEAKKNFDEYGFSDRVKQFLGDAGDILNYLEGSFDFIFLDGAKARYYDYMSDLIRLLAPNGVIFADNVLFRGYVDGSVSFEHSNNTIVRNMRAFINELCENKEFITQVYKIGDGILIAYKR